jgi:hypothetical protein
MVDQPHLLVGVATTSGTYSHFNSFV